MAWNESRITNAGHALYAQALTENGVAIVRAEGAYNVVPDGTLADQTEIETPKMTLNIVRVRNTGSGTEVQVRVYNQGVTAERILRRVGIYARNKGAGTEALLAVIQDPHGVSIPAQADNPEFLLEFSFQLPLSNLETLEMTIDPTSLATLEDVEGVRVYKDIDNIANVDDIKTSGIYSGLFLGFAGATYGLYGTLYVAYAERPGPSPSGWGTPVTQIWIPKNAGSSGLGIQVRGSGIGSYGDGWIWRDWVKLDETHCGCEPNTQIIADSSGYTPGHDSLPLNIPELGALRSGSFFNLYVTQDIPVGTTFPLLYLNVNNSGLKLVFDNQTGAPLTNTTLKAGTIYPMLYAAGLGGKSWVCMTPLGGAGNSFGQEHFGQILQLASPALGVEEMYTIQGIEEVE